MGCEDPTIRLWAAICALLPPEVLSGKGGLDPCGSERHNRWGQWMVLSFKFYTVLELQMAVWKAIN